MGPGAGGGATEASERDHANADACRIRPGRARAPRPCPVARPRRVSSASRASRRRSRSAGTSGRCSHSPLPGVAEPERPAADRPARQRARRRAGRSASRPRRNASRMRAAPRRCTARARLVARVVVAQRRTTILPNCAPLAEPLEGRAPLGQRQHRVDDRQQPPGARARAAIASNSASLPIVEPRIVHWFQNRRRTSVVHHRARRAAAGHEAPAPAERDRATAPTSPRRRCRPRRPRRACRCARGSRAPTSAVRWLSVSSAPSARARVELLVAAATSTQTRRADALGDLQRRQRDAAADAPDQHVVARLHARARDDHAPRGERRERERGRLVAGHRRRHRAHVRAPAPRRTRRSCPGRCSPRMP